MPQLGTAFDRVIARGMAKEPLERPASAGELLRDAAAALGVEVETGTGSSAARGRARAIPAVVRTRRVPTLAMAGVAAAAALAGVVAAVALNPFDGTSASAARPSAETRSLERLGEARTALRSQLATADTPQDQAQAAAELSRAYSRAARDATAPSLAGSARAASSAYQDLATAARANDAGGFTYASAAVLDAERRVGAAARQR